MAVDVHCDSSHGSVFDLVVEAADAHQFLELAPALRDFEPAVVDLLETVIAGEIVRALAGEKDVRSLREQEPGKADRRTRGPKPRDRARAAVASVHDRG